MILKTILQAHLLTYCVGAKQISAALQAKDYGETSTAQPRAKRRFGTSYYDARRRLLGPHRVAAARENAPAAPLVKWRITF